jgi:predicted RNase H-like nuclease (RuvC/YqgF family)
MSRKALIVGVDPGNTSAVAALNLDGELELLESRKEFSRAEIIQEIVETGKPVVVASDRSEMPSTVRKIGQSLGAERFTPDENLDSQTKKALGEGENSHEVDASAAAQYAFNQLRKNIRKIKSYAERNNEDLTEVASNYFSPEPLRTSGSDDIRSEIDRSQKEEPNTEIEKLRSELGELRKANKTLRQQVKDLKEGILDEDARKDEIERLENRLKEKESELEDYNQKIKDLEDQKIDYIEALKKVKEGYEPILKVNERSTVFHDKVVAENEELKKKLLKQGYNARTIDEIKGLELENFVIVEDFPGIDNIADLIGNQETDDS